MSDKSDKKKHSVKSKGRASDKTNTSTVSSESEFKSNKSDVTSGCIRILVVIRESIIRHGLASLLDEQPDFKVIGKAGNCAECYLNALQHPPHVLLCDLDIVTTACPENALVSEGCPFIQLRDAVPGIQTVVMQGDEDSHKILEASRIGIRGYLTTDTSVEALFQAIRVVRNGGTFLEPAVQSSVLGMLRQLNDGERTENKDLNDRERAILQLLAKGKSNQEIADTIFLSMSTVKYYVSTLCTKLNASNRAEAVRIGISKNLITAE